MAAPKNSVTWGLLARLEPTYGTLPSFSASTDGVQLMERVDIGGINYLFDGARGRGPGNFARQPRVAPTGRGLSPPGMMIEGKGAGSAYSASVLPRDLHVFLKASGYEHTVVTTGGAESVTYTPTARNTAPASLGWKYFERAEIWQANGVYCDWEFEITAERPYGVFTFRPFGRANEVPPEGTHADITYAPTVLPPVPSPLVMTINAVTALIIRRFAVKGGRKVTERPNTGGHAGFQPAEREPVVEFTVEAPLYATINLKSLRDAPTTPFALSVPVAGAQYNRYTWSFPQGQISDVKESEDAGVALLEGTFTPHCTTANATDDISLAFT